MQLIPKLNQEYNTNIFREANYSTENVLRGKKSSMNKFQLYFRFNNYDPLCIHSGDIIFRLGKADISKDIIISLVNRTS